MLRIVATNTLGAALFALLVGLVLGGQSVVTYFLATFVYANVIGIAAHLLLPSVAGRLAGRAPIVFWLAVGGTLLGLALVGSLVAGALVAALGLFGHGSAWAGIRTGMGISVVLTLSAGGVITLYEITRKRLDEARESLKARELEAERAQRLASDARLASLESRLHPHFLFNAIAAIAGQVHDEPERAERLLLEFSDLLRASLDSTRHHTVPLGDELGIARAYLEIEQARLGERLRCKVEVPDDLLAWPVPPFALHTLVQNSVKHVASSRTRGAEIRVEARRAGDRLALSVWDDGPGFDLDAAPAGHGLETLRARLAVLFGPDGATLHAAREYGGCRVTMALRAQTTITG
jgi:sensor histidine kinase YesM